MLIVLTSASGSPGVTATAVGLASVWPRPVILIEADPTGGSGIAAGRFAGGQLPTTSTIVDAGVAQRDGQLGEKLASMLVPIPGTLAHFLPGTVHHSQARSLTGLWEPLAHLARQLDTSTGQDVIVDAGRLGLDGYPMPLLLHADAVLLATRSTLPALVAAASWSETLHGMAPETTGVVLIGPGNPYGPSEVRKALDLPVVATIAHDPTAVKVYDRGTPAPKRHSSSSLYKSLVAAVAAIQTPRSRDE